MTDGKIRAFKFGNFVRNGRTFTQILNDRANDADKRVRIDKNRMRATSRRSRFVSPTHGRPREASRSMAGTHMVACGRPLPFVEAKPDVSKFSKEWAIAMAKHDPASWINRNAFPSWFGPRSAKGLRRVHRQGFRGPQGRSGHGGLRFSLEIVGNHPDKFADLGREPVQP